jgi:hypothetical protein
MLTLEFGALSKPSDTISLPANVSVPSAVERLSPSKESILESRDAGHKYEWIGLEKQAKFAQEYRDYGLYLSRQDLHCSGHRARPSGLPGPRASPAWYQALPEQAQRLACWEHCVSDHLWEKHGISAALRQPPTYHLPYLRHAVFRSSFVRSYPSDSPALRRAFLDGL